MNRKRIAAFTLIEILVVVSIIAVLAAILFPVFSSAKNAAKGAACISNMHQIGLASLMYVDEYDGQWYPASKYEPLTGFVPQKTWIGYDNANTGTLAGGFYGNVALPATGPIREGFIDPFIKNDGLKRCPNKTSEQQTALALNGFDPGLNSAYYGTNPEAQGKEYGPSLYRSTIVEGVLDTVGVTDAAVQEPANTLLAWEHLAYAPMCNFLQSPDWLYSAPTIDTLQDHFNFLHLEGTNTVFVDGHAKRITYGALKRPMFSVRKDIYPPG